MKTDLHNEKCRAVLLTKYKYVNKERFESMNCFKKYKSYTNTNNIPTFCRDLS